METTVVMPWYDDYIWIIEEKRIVIEEKDSVLGSATSLNTVLNFYNDIGADFKKNTYIEEEYINYNKLETSEKEELSQYSKKIDFVESLERAVVSKDEQSVHKLAEYLNSQDSIYKNLIRQIIMYIGVSRVATDPMNYIEKAYNELFYAYPLSSINKFTETGYYYYAYYIQCLSIAIINYQGNKIKILNMVDKRIMNIRLMLNNYKKDEYISNKVESLLNSLKELDRLIEREKSRPTYNMHKPLPKLCGAM